MEYVGYALALLIGVSLGLLGSGGSILTLPILVYFFGLDAIHATAYSLFIVGVSAAFGATHAVWRKEVDLKLAFLFALPSMLAVYMVRRYVMPVLPEILGECCGISVPRDGFIVGSFAVLMGLSAIKMWGDHNKILLPKETKIAWFWIVLEGFLIGSVTGFVGAGGGFIIIPALVLLMGMPMKEAVPTSLVVIALKSLVGFMGDAQTLHVQWSLLLILTGLAVLGIYVGMQLSARFSAARLKRYFAGFVLGMAIFMLAKELFYTP